MLVRSDNLIVNIFPSTALGGAPVNILKVMRGLEKKYDFITACEFHMEGLDASIKEASHRYFNIR